MSETKSTSEYKKILAKHKNWQFPEFKVNELKPKKNKYCVCVFVINEGKKIQKQLKQMKKYTDSVDVIVADGGSTDDSLNNEILKETKVRTLLTKTGPGKLSAQMRMAFAYAMDQGYDGVIAVDGNGKDDISAIPAFIKLLDDGYDHIQGSRFIPGGKAINTPFERHIAVKILHSPLISAAAHHRHTDTTNGFRAYSRRLITDPDVAVFRDVFMTYELHYHMAIESGRNKKYKLTETPVTRAYPPKGKTPTKISPIKGNLHVMGILIKAVRGKYRYQK